jgi:hypothetical protein
MTAQMPDSVRIGGRRYDLCEISGGGLFDPADHDIATEAPDTACWRGFICGYTVSHQQLLLDDLELWSEPSRWAHNRTQLELVFGERISLDDDRHRAGATGLAHPIPFTGSLLIARDFIEDLYVHMGLQEAHNYREVLELTFESGRLLTNTDRSEEMAEIRRSEAGDASDSSEDLVDWIDDSMRIDF